MRIIKVSRAKLEKLVFFALLLVYPLSSLAQPATFGPSSCPPSAAGMVSNPIDVCTINDFIKTLLEGVLKIGMPIVALAIIYSGFLFVAARGNTEKLTKAKDSLLYTLIGAAVLLGAWAIAQLIANTVLGLAS